MRCGREPGWLLWKGRLLLRPHCFASRPALREKVMPSVECHAGRCNRRSPVPDRSLHSRLLDVVADPLSCSDYRRIHVSWVCTSRPWIFGGQSCRFGKISHRASCAASWRGGGVRGQCDADFPSRSFAQFGNSLVTTDAIGRCKLRLPSMLPPEAIARRSRAAIRTHSVPGDFVRITTVKPTHHRCPSMQQ
jgi:hypothetical protein